MKQVQEGQYYGSIKETLEMSTPTPTPFYQVCSSENVLEKTRFILRFQNKRPKKTQDVLRWKDEVEEGGGPNVDGDSSLQSRHTRRKSCC